MCAAPHGGLVPEQIHMTEQEKTSAWTDGLSQKPVTRDLWRDLPPDGLGVQGQWLPHSSGAQSGSNDHAEVWQNRVKSKLSVLRSPAVVCLFCGGSSSNLGNGHMVASLGNCVKAGGKRYRMTLFL